MAQFPPLRLTDNGIDLLAKCQTGVELRFTCIKLGDGAEKTPEADEMTHIICEVPPLSQPYVEDGWARIDFSVVSKTEQGFFFRELGLYAVDPDLGEILYSYAHSGETADWIPPAVSSSPYQQTISIRARIENAENVTAVIGDFAVVTQEDLNRHNTDKNAHQYIQKRIDDLKPSDIGAAEADHVHDFGVPEHSHGTLSNARTIDGVSFDGSKNINHYGACSTTASATAKTVDVDGFVRAVGARVTVKFTNGNTAANPTLNVKETGAAYMFYKGAAVSTSMIVSDGTYDFVFNGTQYDLISASETAAGAEKGLVFYGSCTIAAGTAAKTTMISGFTVNNLVVGAIVGVVFTQGNTNVTPTLNVSGTGAKYIRYKGSSITAEMIPVNMVALFEYDGSYWQLLNPDALTTAKAALDTANAAGMKELVRFTASGTFDPKNYPSKNNLYILMILGGGGGGGIGPSTDGFLGGWSGNMILTPPTVITSSMSVIVGAGGTSQSVGGASIVDTGSYRFTVLGGSPGIDRFTDPTLLIGNIVYHYNQHGTWANKDGGPSMYGKGGLYNSSGNGSDATGYGAGGGGGAAGYSGGKGSPGLVIVFGW